MTYQSTKTFGHELGISCCFRQWRAKSHCQFLHGYALSFKFTFECTELDMTNWCVDFGNLKPLKDMVMTHFDHKLVIAEDDPCFDHFVTLNNLNIADVITLPAVGCEAFAKFAYDLADSYIIGLQILEPIKRVRVISCEVREHGANSAIYFGE
jgi:6-pyruvoyltetrahydropterin/6-carboxytetrahydropterin synthase